MHVLTVSSSVLVCLHTVNVATGKTYSQSSKFNDQVPSSNAANGDTSGNYPSNCIHTNVILDGSKYIYDTDPWWEVDLGRTYPVYNIEVWAREGCELVIHCDLKVINHRLTFYHNTFTQFGMLGARIVKLVKHRRELINCTKFIKHFDAILFPLFNKLSVVWSIFSSSSPYCTVLG